MRQKRLMVMAGGTGGHVFPGLAVAQYLMGQGWQVRWLGTSDRMEADLVPKHGIEIDFIQISGLRNKGLKVLLAAPFRIFYAILQAKTIMKAYQPDVVLGMGGYVSGPGGVAAWLQGIPVVLHEQNGVAGLTNRWLARIATRVLQAFPSAFKQADVVGNPVRTDVLSLPLPEVRFADRQGAIRILVIGGSQGARVLNQTIPKMASQMGERVTIWHQVGKGSLESVEQGYNKQGAGGHRVVEFIDDMAEAYGWADLVICRSGALTVSEIAATGLPAIFIPFRHKDRQQYWNALPLAQAQAAVIIEQQDFSVEVLMQELNKLDRLTLLTMAKRARQMAIPDATEKVAAAICAAVKS